MSKFCVWSRNCGFAGRSPLLILHVRSAIEAPEVPLVAQQDAIVLALEPHKRWFQGPLSTPWIMAQTPRTSAEHWLLEEEWRQVVNLFSNQHSDVKSNQSYALSLLSLLLYYYCCCGSSCSYSNGSSFLLLLLLLPFVDTSWSHKTIQILTVNAKLRGCLSVAL